MTQRPAPRHAHVGLRTAVLAVGLTGLGIVATAGVTEAHTPAVQATCTELHYTFELYDGGDTTNLLTVTVDGTTVVDQRFGSSLSGDVPWDSSIPHTWTVAVDANVNEPGNTQWDFSTAGSEEPCTTPTSTTPTTQPPTTTEPTSTPTTETPTTEAPTTTTPPTSETPTTAETPTTGTPTTTTEPVATTTGSSESSTTPAAAPTVEPTPSTSGAVPDRPAVLAVESPTLSAGVAASTSANHVDAAAATTPAAPTSTTLPATGTNAGLQSLVALALVAAGVGLIAITRRRGARRA